QRTLFPPQLRTGDGHLSRLPGGDGRREGSAPAGEKGGGVIVDFHCHAGRGDGMTGPPFTDAPLDKYLRRARAAGIDRTVVVPCFHSDYSRANAELARIVAGNPRLIGFAFVHPRRDAGRIRAMVRRAVRTWGFRGIKVHAIEAPP